MKKILFAAVAAALLCSCAQQTLTPVQEAVKNEAVKTLTGDVSFKYTDFQLLDSTTFATEIDRRIDVFNTKISQNLKYLEKYMNEGKRKNAQAKFAEIQKDKRILGELMAIKEQMGEDAEAVAYYDYSFSGEAKADGKKILFENCFVTVTPDNKVLTMANSCEDIHKGTGVVIPGYRELLDSNIIEAASAK